MVEVSKVSSTNIMTFSLLETVKSPSSVAIASVCASTFPVRPSPTDASSWAGGLTTRLSTPTVCTTRRHTEASAITPCVRRRFRRLKSRQATMMAVHATAHTDIMAA